MDTSDFEPTTALTTALADLRPLLQPTTAAQRALPTPCDGFTVLELVRHVIGWLGYFDDALRHPTASTRPDPEASDGADADAVIATLSARIDEAARDLTGSEVVDVPRLGGSLPRSLLLDLLLVEVLGHGWDLARATGADWAPDPATCEHALGVLRGVVLPEYRGPGLPFAAEVPVRSDAPAEDRLLAFLGRDPHWTRAEAA